MAKRKNLPPPPPPCPPQQLRHGAHSDNTPSLNLHDKPPLSKRGRLRPLSVPTQFEGQQPSTLHQRRVTAQPAIAHGRSSRTEIHATSASTRFEPFACSPQLAYLSSELDQPAEIRVASSTSSGAWPPQLPPLTASVVHDPSILDGFRQVYTSADVGNCDADVIRQTTAAPALDVAATGYHTKAACKSLDSQSVAASDSPAFAASELEVERAASGTCAFESSATACAVADPVEALPEHVFALHVLPRLCPRHVSRSCALVTRGWAQVCASAPLWQAHCERHGLTRRDAALVLGGWRGLFGRVFGANLVGCPNFERIGHADRLRAPTQSPPRDLPPHPSASAFHATPAPPPSSSSSPTEEQAEAQAVGGVLTWGGSVAGLSESDDDSSKPFESAPRLYVERIATEGEVDDEPAAMSHWAPDCADGPGDGMVFLRGGINSVVRQMCNGGRWGGAGGGFAPLTLSGREEAACALASSSSSPAWDATRHQPWDAASTAASVCGAAATSLSGATQGGCSLLHCAISSLCDSRESVADAASLPSGAAACVHPMQERGEGEEHGRAAMLMTELPQRPGWPSPLRLGFPCVLKTSSTEWGRLRQTICLGSFPPAFLDSCPALRLSVLCAPVRVGLRGRGRAASSAAGAVAAALRTEAGAEWRGSGSAVDGVEATAGRLGTEDVRGDAEMATPLFRMRLLVRGEQRGQVLAHMDSGEVRVEPHCGAPSTPRVDGASSAAACAMAAGAAESAACLDASAWKKVQATVVGYPKGMRSVVVKVAGKGVRIAGVTLHFMSHL